MKLVVLDKRGKRYKGHFEHWLNLTVDCILGNSTISTLNLVLWSHRRMSLFREMHLSASEHRAWACSMPRVAKEL